MVTAANRAAVAPLVEVGHSYRDIASRLGWSYHRVSETVRALRGLPSDSERRKARKAEQAVKAAVVVEETSVPA